MNEIFFACSLHLIMAALLAIPCFSMAALHGLLPWQWNLKTWKGLLSMSLTRGCLQLVSLVCCCAFEGEKKTWKSL
jgi:hypothetical protein